MADLSMQLGSLTQQIQETTSATIAFLPSLILAIIILIIGWILGRFLGGVIATVLDRIGVDDALRKTSLGEWIEKSGMNIVHLFDLIVRWIIYLLAILAAIDILQITTLSILVAGFIAYIPNIIAFIVILVVGFILVDWFLDLFRAYGESRQIEFTGIITLVLRAFLYFVVAILALEQLMIDLTIIYTFLVPVAWGVGIGVGAAIAFFFFYGLRDRAPQMMDDLLSHTQMEMGKIQQEEAGPKK